MYEKSMTLRAVENHCYMDWVAPKTAKILLIHFQFYLRPNKAQTSHTSSLVGLEGDAEGKI